MTEEKRCKSCNILKPVDQFWRHRRTADRIEYKCKDCLRPLQKATRERRADQKKAHNRAYYERRKAAGTWYVRSKKDLITT